MDDWFSSALHHPPSHPSSDTTDGSGETAIDEGFRKTLAEGQSPVITSAQLWTDPHICFVDRGRLPFKSYTLVVRPDVRAESIMAAVAAAARQCGLRINDHDDGGGTLTAERLEAPFLAHLAKNAAAARFGRFWGGGSSTASDNPHEWRVLAATLGVSRGRADWGGVERMLQLRFLTDTVSEATHRKMSAASSVATPAEAADPAYGGSSANNDYRDGSGGTGGEDSRIEVGRKGSGSAVAFARDQSKQRAQSLVEGVLLELAACGATTADVPGWEASWPLLQSDGADGTVATGPAPAVAAAPSGESEVEVPLPAYVDLTGGAFSGGGGAPMPVKPAAAAAAAAVLPSRVRRAAPVDLFELAVWGAAAKATAGDCAGAVGGFDAPNGDRFDAGTADAVPVACGTHEVELDLHFVDCVCARARGLSLLDAHETWKPLKRAMSELEAENAILKKLLEPKYRQLGLALASQPKYASGGGGGGGGGAGAGGSNSSNGSGSSASNSDGGLGCGEAGSMALRANPLFRYSDSSVTACVRPRCRHLATPTNVSGNSGAGGGGSSGGGCGSGGDCGGASFDDSSFGGSSTGGGEASSGGKMGGASPSAGALLKAAVALLCGTVEAEFEMAAEALVKGRVRGAQRYVTELESYRHTLVADVALSRPAKGDSEELQNVFGVAGAEALLVSCQAALGRRPGKLFVTHSSLWFHSKLLGQHKYILPLSTVLSAEVMASPLRLSSSVVIKTAYLEEVLFIFPATSPSSVEPLALLIRRLLALQQQERARSPLHGGKAGADSGFLGDAGTAAGGDSSGRRR